MVETGFWQACRSGQDTANGASDFPHDSYWKSAVVEFSDGSLVSIQITNSYEFQEFSFPKRQVSWFRIHDLVPEDPARWCAFIEVEAWGARSAMMLNKHLEMRGLHG